MRTITIFLVQSLITINLAATNAGCSSAQKAEEKALAKCVAADVTATEAELNSTDDAAVKAAKITAEAYACYQQAKAAGAATKVDAGVGSAK